MPISLNATPCAICGSFGNATEVYPARFRPEDLNPEVFSARRNPDRVHYRIVRCAVCGLLRSDPVADASVTSRLYEKSEFSYGEELENLERTYGSYLCRLEQIGGTKGSLLEIGCGNGFFLKVAMSRGWKTVQGIEPSERAIQSAPPSVRGRIIQGVIHPDIFARATFDAVCMFQVIDHLPDPSFALAACRTILAPGGFLLILSHDASALSARVLGEKSPIIDIEHTYLFTPSTIRQILLRHGLEVVKIGAATNRYSLSYLVHLLGAPSSVKRLLASTRIGRLPLRLPLGNFYAIARKPLGRRAQ